LGNEAVCHVRVGKDAGEAKALLETDEVIVRGALKARIPFAAITNVTVDGDTLVLRTAEQSVEIAVGAREAQRWAEKIRNPKGRLDKLGVKPGQTVSVLGSIADDDFEAELRGRGVELTTGRARPKSDLIFFGVTKARDLDRLATLRKSLQPAGAIWILRPKGATTISEMDVLTATKLAGLVDTKVVRFSDTLSAAKAVIPVAQRGCPHPFLER